jgi:hypothetical protein
MTQIRFDSPLDTVIGRPRDVTRYDVRIIDTIKPHATLPPIQGRLTLTRRGGQHTESGRIVRSAEKGFEDFRQNGEYVLFLTWISIGTWYTLGTRFVSRTRESPARSSSAGAPPASSLNRVTGAAW